MSSEYAWSNQEQDSQAAVIARQALAVAVAVAVAVA